MDSPGRAWTRLALVLFFALTAAAEPFAVSPPVEIRSAAGSRGDIHLATNGDTSLVVWREARGRSAVRGAMVDRNLQPLGDRDFSISTFADAYYGPSIAVATNGTDYLVAHSQHVGPDWQTRFTRVSAAGEIRTSAEAVGGLVRSMVFAGGHYLVVTMPDQASSPAKLAIVDGYGHVVRSGVPVAFDDATHDARLVATSAGHLLIVWSAWNLDELWTAVIDPVELFSPTWLGASPAARLENMRFDLVSVAEGKDGFLIAGIDREKARDVLTLALLNPDGTLRRRDDLRDSPEHAEIGALQVERVQDEYVVIADRVLIDEQYYYTASLRVTPSGVRPLSEFQPFTLRGVWEMSVVRRRDGWLQWAFITNGRAEIGTAATLVGGAVRAADDDAVLLSRSYPDQELPAVAQCSGSNIVAWQDTWHDVATLRLRRFGADGVPLDPPNRSLSSFAYRDYQPSGLSIVCGTANALITWLEPAPLATGRMRGAILRPDGTLLDLGVMGQAARTSAVFDGTAFVILSYDPAGIDQWQRWSEQGTRLATQTMPEFGGPRALLDFQLAWNGATFMVVTYEHRLVDGNPRYDVRALELRPNLIATGPPVTVAQDMIAGVSESLVLAARPGGWLASWWDCGDRCGAFTSTLNGSEPAFVRESTMQRQLSWNGAEWELLGEHGVLLLGVDGRIAGFHRLTSGEEVDAMAVAGTPRLFVFRRYDVESGATRLYAGFSDVTEPRRRRTARH